MENRPEQSLGLSDPSRVIKRQRARRPRHLPSPRGSTTPTAASSSSSVGGGDYNSVVDAAEGEDEDMANCLILLAQGDGTASPNDHQEHVAQEESIPQGVINSGVRSKKVSELGVVYECKTCNRVFPSFQALGGHRASHSKPTKANGMLLEDQLINRTRDHDHHQEGQIYRTNLSPGPTPVLGLPGMSLGARTGKVHECSVCGLEFASGQALGGHMRRHRSSSALMNSDEPAVSARPDDLNQKPRKFLALDLNLPAPEEDDDGDSIFGYGPGQPVPPPLFISASALVDCHY
ncbi:zinc finger protein ZAT5-like [Punica granatum]|uniref:C2H2-type domain-containing protein n=2 Tax=Punica granatum TaxID=22663 RepID=A0A218W7T0_PUNGR|nr:zinc finger protein ZAT5-like [Punica granatum]OWM68937.1 hypothetical protein CDL15_Pgr025124 [Punica granatum]PKI78806.1 hypothetical protein CRG98_000873 [Punica granatum]